LEGGSSGNLSSYWLAVEKIRQNAAQAVLKTLFEDPNPSLNRKWIILAFFRDRLSEKRTAWVRASRPSNN
jgi:hypothetical protein